ncbi:MAG: hypothetical protein SFT94_12795 [Pseudanabaenaceae cyanobacterium bins.68]|nr:hypothetical protein [Pseudanabaenaceae cyanobacterium bins.68]
MTTLNADLNAPEPEIEFSAELDQSNAPGEIDNLFAEGDQPDATSDREPTLHTYKPGDPYLKINNQSPIKILVLKQIYDSELSVKKKGDDLKVVYYEGEPIVEMRGIDFIQTENGVAPLENWMFS